ncbi:hypothetical protein COO60DRAFT_1144071 [Scenedesmus sp. NREL 46B-D3]|nr:hypothetical protein COO60DRAFT_1144071 [Scenedesmus sp. NREL 46B-D3]
MQCSSLRSARPRLRSGSQYGANIVVRNSGAVAPRVVSANRRSPGCKHATSAARKDLEPISLDNQKRIAIIGSVDDVDVLSSTDEADLKQLSAKESAGALPPPGTSTATKGAGTGLAEALNLAAKPPGSSSSSAAAAAAAAAADDLPNDDATDPELASWVEQLQQESMALAMQLSQYRSQAAAKIASLAARPTLEPAARQELEELTAVLQAALAQVDVLSRQAALAEVLQHRIADQEDVLQQLQNELEHVDAQRAAEYETTLANINELEEALALAQDQVDASHRLEELLEVKEALQKQLEGAQADLEAAAGQLADSRKKGEALAAQLATAEEAKGLAEQAKGAAEEARKEAEARLATLKEEYEQLQAEVKKAQEAAEQLAAAAQQQKDAAAAAPQQQSSRGKKGKKQKGGKGFAKVDAAGKGATQLTTGETGEESGGYNDVS